MTYHFNCTDLIYIYVHYFMCVLIYLILDLLIYIEMAYFINPLFMFGGLNVSIY